MNDSNAIGESSMLVSAAALLRSRGMAYEDGDEYMTIWTGLSRYQRRELKIPKDGHSDMFRLSDALRRKIPVFMDNENLMRVIDVPLEGKSGRLSPEAYSLFYSGWQDRVAEFTTRRWGGCFQTTARAYKQRGVVMVLNLGEIPHYYNIVLSPEEKEEFEDTNPELVFESCDGVCAGYEDAHFHGVHGYYKGSKVGGIDCAPPIWLDSTWKILQDFPLDQPLDFVAGPDLDGTYADLVYLPHAAPYWAQEYKAGGGAWSLAIICEGPQKGWSKADWTGLCELYLSPEAASWGLAKAYDCSKAGQRKIKRSWDKTFSDVILPKLRGTGSPIPDVLQQIWRMDRTVSKTFANYLLRRLFTTANPVYDSGTLRI